MIRNLGNLYRTNKEDFLDYQKNQNKDVFNNVDYIVSFIGEDGLLSRFIGVFKLNERKQLASDHKEYDRLKETYKVNKELILASKKNTTALHPLPRVTELSTDVDDLPNAAYFRQAEYGVTVRMVLLSLCLKKDF